MPHAFALTRIPLVREGEDAVRLDPSTYTVTFTEGADTVEVVFRAYQGTTQVYLGTVTASGDIPGVTMSPGTAEAGTISRIFTRNDPNTEVNAQVDFTGTISGGTLAETVQQTVTLHFLSIAPGEDGESAFDINIDPPYVFFTEGVTVVNVTAKVYYGSEVLDYYDGMQSAAWSGLPDGVAVTRVSQGSGIVNYRFTRTSADTEVDGTATLGLTAAPSGTGISVDLTRTIKVLSLPAQCLPFLSNPCVEFVESGTQDVYVRAIKGSGYVALTGSMVTVSPDSGSGWVVNNEGAEGDAVRLSVTYMGGTIDTTVTVTVTIDGVAYPLQLQILTMPEGAKGDKGDPGDDAVYYELDATGSTAVYKAIAGAFAPASITFSGYKVTGTDRAAAEGDFTIYYHGTDDGESASWHQVDAGSGWSFTLDFATAVSDYNLRYGFPTEFRMLWVADEDATARIERVIPLSNSYAIRGPQRWDDLSDSYEFQSGQVGEIYLDVVIHEVGGADNYYYCINSHTKNTADSEPGTHEYTTGNNGYWQQMNKLDSVATSLLLADYAKIANLYVDDLFMVGQKTVIWVNPDNDGMKINPVSVLNGDTDRANQSAQGAAWTNPLVEFSAADLPDIDTIYGNGADGNATLAASSGSYTGANLAEENYSGSGWGAVEPDINNYTRLGTLTEGAMTRVAGSFPSSGALSMTLTEGEISGDATRDPEYYMSHVSGELRLSDSNSGEGTYIVLAQVNAICSSNEAGASVTVEFKAFDTTFSSPFSGTAYLQIYLARGEVRCNSMGATASVRFSGGIIASISAVTEQYVARYVGQGAFLGLKSDTYARFALISGQSRHTLLVEGNGLDISSDGFMQKTEQKASVSHSVPPGGTLLTAWVSVSGGSIQANYWTWDGAAISMRWADTGSYAFSIPSTWETKLRGDSTLNASHFAINVTAIQGRTAGYTANVWYAEQGEVQVVLRNANGDLQDGASYLTVHYIGDGQSI